MVRAGPLHWASLRVGLIHTCPLWFEAEAYSWGNSAFGEGGYGEEIGVQTEVTTVSGGHRFHGIAVGGSQACRVTADGKLGDGTTEERHLPTEVTSDLRLTAVSPGATHTCGVSVDEDGYWRRSNDGGQLGDGSGEASLVPVAVAGGLRFRDITAGGGHTCGLTATGEGYCWGSNEVSQLGGPSPDRTRPPKLADPGDIL